MNKNPADASQPYRSLIAGYTDAIRASDFKANIAILFVAFMMGPVLGNYTRFPSYLPIPFVMLPFLIVYLCLFAVLIPRYPGAGPRISWSRAPRQLAISPTSRRRKTNSSS